MDTFRVKLYNDSNDCILDEIVELLFLQQAGTDLHPTLYEFLFQLDKTHKDFKFVAKPVKVDRFFFLKSNGNHLVVPWHPRNKIQKVRCNNG